MAEDILRPSSDVSVVNIPQGAGSNYQCVDEATPDEDTTYVWNSSSSWKYDVYGLPAHSGSGTINSVTVYGRFKTVGETWPRVKVGVRTHATDYYGNEEIPTASYSNFSKQWADNPNTSSSWTWDEIDDLCANIGISCQDVAGTIRCTQVYVVVDYVSAAGRSIAIIIA